jgi:UDP:flavonoid glycosyltransferase YjiC (YdhE family)
VPAIAAAVQAVPHEPAYRERAQALAAEYARHDACSLIRAELVQVGNRQPADRAG